ncbi:hypothetical protein EI94DRAFT_1705125 [Lactarius quietus]|nr:hypothetical protein EI94DRAFT_1705125 [Lactarius quietus]
MHWTTGSSSEDNPVVYHKRRTFGVELRKSILLRTLFYSYVKCEVPTNTGTRPVVEGELGTCKEVRVLIVHQYRTAQEPVYLFNINSATTTVATVEATVHQNANLRAHLAATTSRQGPRRRRRTVGAISLHLAHSGVTTRLACGHGYTHTSRVETVVHSRAYGAPLASLETAGKRREVAHDTTSWKTGDIVGTFGVGARLEAGRYTVKGQLLECYSGTVALLGGSWDM